MPLMAGGGVLTSAALLRYRVMALAVSVALVVLVLIGVPLHYLAGQDAVSAVVGQLHGIVLYPLYLLATFDVARRARWGLSRTLLVMLAGTVPFLSFYIERQVARELSATAARH